MDIPVEGLQRTGQPSSQTSHELHGNEQNDPDVETTDIDSASDSNRRMFTWKYIDHVKNLIESCLYRQMNMKEAAQILLTQARIKPVLTNIIWQALKRDNPAFFRSYHMRLEVKRQIMVFNQLLVRQIHLMKTLMPPNFPSTSLQNGSNLFEGYPCLQQPPMPAMAEPHIGFVGHELPNYHVANGVCAPPSCHPLCMNCGNDKPYAQCAVPSWSAMSSNVEMTLSPESLVSSSDFPPCTSGVDSPDSVSRGGVGFMRDSLNSPGQLSNFSASNLKEDITQSGGLAAAGVNIDFAPLPLDLEALIKSPAPEHMDFGALEQTANSPLL